MIVLMMAAGYFFAAMSNGPRHAEMMINLLSVIMGPGIFRVLRTLRDTVTCRVWHYTKYTSMKPNVKLVSLN